MYYPYDKRMDKFAEIRQMETADPEEKIHALKNFIAAEKALLKPKGLIRSQVLLIAEKYLENLLGLQEHESDVRTEAMVGRSLFRP